MKKENPNIMSCDICIGGKHKCEYNQPGKCPAKAWDTDEEDVRRNPKQSKVTVDNSPDEDEGLIGGLINAVRELTREFRKAAERSKQDMHEVHVLLSQVVLEMRFGRYVPTRSSEDADREEDEVEARGNEGVAEEREEREEQEVVERLDDAEMQEPGADQA